MLYKKSDLDKTLTFVNNAFGNLTDIVCPDQYKIKYRYDIFGRRLSKEYVSENENLIESYIYIGNQEIGTIDEDKNINQLQVPGAFYNLDTGRSIAFELNDEILSPIYDFQGNIISLVDYYHGDVVESYDYSAFGEEKIFDENDQPLEASKISNPWRFATKRKDDVIHLIAFGFRDYDQSLKRWINPDPIGFIDGNNKYAFVSNNPLKYIDILGLSKHHYYAKHDSFDDYFYFKRTEDDKKGADTNLLDDTHLWNRFKTTLRKDLDFLVDAGDSLVQASSILQTGVGIIEIGTGIVGLGGSGALEVASVGGASVIAVPVAAGSIALIADGAIKVGIGVALYKKKSNDKYYDHNLDKQYKGMPKTRNAQKKQFEGAYKEIEKEIGKKLDRDSRQRLHRAIHGQNYGYRDIVELGIEMFKKV